MGATIFAERFSSWFPLPGVILSLEPISDPRCQLRITGRSPTTCTYFHGVPLELRQGVRYRLAGKVLVEKIDPPVGPAFTFLYLAKLNGNWDWQQILGTASTSRYDLTKGGWQTLSTEFLLHPQASGGRIHFSKVENRSIEIRAAIESIELAEV